MSGRQYRIRREFSESQELLFNSKDSSISLCYTPRWFQSFPFLSQHYNNLGETELLKEKKISPFAMTSLTIGELPWHLFLLSYYCFSLSKLFLWFFLTPAPDFIFLPFGIQSLTTFLVPLYYICIMLKMSFLSTQPQALLAKEPRPIPYHLWKYKQLCLLYLSLSKRC